MTKQWKCFLATIKRCFHTTALSQYSMQQWSKARSQLLKEYPKCIRNSWVNWGRGGAVKGRDKR